MSSTALTSEPSHSYQAPTADGTQKKASREKNVKSTLCILLQAAKGKVNIKTAVGNSVFRGLDKEGTEGPAEASSFEPLCGSTGTNSIVGHCSGHGVKTALFLGLERNLE